MIERLSSSFRDPAGFLYRRDGRLYRQINQSALDDFHRLRDSGLYQSLIADGLLVPHEEVDTASYAATANAQAVIRPQELPFISYPYEWCFSQLRDAALLTLDLADRALDHDMVLKDASAYNVQFVGSRPVFIDTLSFSGYAEGEPWVAYRQFCQHFLAPLLLMTHVDVRLEQLLRVYIDGVPLDLASRLLPLRTRFSFGTLAHIHAHARSQVTHADKARVPDQGARQGKAAQVSRIGLKGLLDSLRSVVRRAGLKRGKTEWGDYYSDTNYSAESKSEKARIITGMVAELAPARLWDIGGNTGVYGRIARAAGAGHVVVWDIDPVAIEKSYQQGRSDPDDHTLSLLADLTNPSPGLGWANAERDTLAQRGPVDMVMALALIHHLAISNNVPLARVAGYLWQLGHHLILEFVPKEDSQVKRLLVSREDVFPDYNEAGLEAAFSEYFAIDKKVSIAGTERTLYLMSRRG